MQYIQILKINVHPSNTNTIRYYPNAESKHSYLLFVCLLRSPGENVK